VQLHRDTDRELHSTDLGGFVRERRHAARLTQQALAELAGVGKRLVVELEANKPTLRLDAVNRVLAVFGRAVGAVEMRRSRGSEVER
jgi:y4mF family transcriptional regulator